MSIIHLIVGSTGAGKTTYARTLAQELDALRFSTDEWMDDLFVADKPDDAGFDWYWPRIQRCEQRMWDIARQALHLGTPIVLDLGLSTRDHREQQRARALVEKRSVRLHFLDIDAETRWRRVQKRNREQGDTFRLTVTREMFDFVEARFERPDDDELIDAVIIRD